jgi:hypothetical protein
MALSKFFKREEPTPITLVEPEPAAPAIGDIEKANTASYKEGEHHELQHHVDPEIEKRVVRKLDRNVVPLVMALCMASLVSSGLLDFQLTVFF